MPVASIAVTLGSKSGKPLPASREGACLLSTGAAPLLCAWRSPLYTFCLTIFRAVEEHFRDICSLNTPSTRGGAQGRRDSDQTEFNLNFALQIPAPGLTVAPKLLILFVVILFLSETESH